MRSKPTRIAAAIVLAGLVAVAAGCGGGSKNSTPGTTPSASTPTTSSAATTSSSSGSVPSFASAKNCQDLAGLAAKVASTLAASSSSANLTNVLQTESNELKALAQAAPSDIRGDFQTFSTAFSGFLQALQKSGYKPSSKTPPTAAQIAALSTAARSFNAPKLKQAEQHLSAWAHQNCKGVHVGG